MSKLQYETVQLLTTGQMKELISALVEAIPAIPADIAQGWIGNKKALAKGLRELLLSSAATSAKEAKSVQDLLADWQSFYRDAFGMEVDFSGIRIPERQEGFSRLLVAVQGITAQKVYDKCKELFLCWKYTDRNLDEAVSVNDRTPEDGSYAIWLWDRVEADEELKNMSADTLKRKGIPGITLAERLLYELKYHKETGKHLDIDNWTLCAGSRDDFGVAPIVCWYGYYSGLHVGWCSPGSAGDDLRSRGAVS